MVPKHAVLPRVFGWIFLPLLGMAPLRAASNTISGAGGLTVTVESNGAYTVAVPTLAWKFAGQTGYPIINIYTAAGADGMGAYQEISFDCQSDALRHAAIRTWFAQKSVLFTVSNQYDAPNTFAFPSWAQYPQGRGRIAFAGMFGYPTFFGKAEDSPWVAFDAASNTFVLSPVTHAMVASTVVTSTGALISGISSQITTLPAGFSHQTLLVIESGINRAFDTWGQTMTALHAKTRPANDADPTLKLLGYWTDNGASYYYQTAPQTNYVDTLAAVKADFDRNGIALGYLQLDSWFYPKGPAADWNDHTDGLYQYRAATSLFPNGLARFQQTLGIPLMTHSRWIDPSSPYRQQYKMSGNVSTDPLYWADVAHYLSVSGVTAYEQDWLYNEAQSNFNLTDPEAFLDNMSGALAQQNVNMQYCMPSGRHFLESARYSNLTTIRVSPDRFDRTRWRDFVYASRLASALGIWPFTDVFMSTETDNLLLATLSAGPVGVGDAIGTMSASNLLRAVRPDGVIVKPDVPLTPIDASFQSDSQNLQAPLISSTYSDFGGLRAYYLFAFPQGSNTQAVFQLSDLGVNQPAYLYNFADGTGRLVQPGDVLSEPVTNNWIYQEAAPIGYSGIAVIGDTAQFVPLGKKRIPQLSDDGTVHLTVAFARSENARTIEGYSPDAPTIIPIAGNVGAVVYNPQSQRFQVTVMPGADGTASLQIARTGAAAGLQGAHKR